jgi:hypothetical protein
MDGSRRGVGVSARPLRLTVEGKRLVALTLKLNLPPVVGVEESDDMLKRTLSRTGIEGFTEDKGPAVLPAPAPALLEASKPKS